MSDAIRFRRNIDERFVTEQLPDGTLAIFDSRLEAVHSLNESAAIVLAACEESATAIDVAVLIARCTGRAVDHEVALDVLRRLESAQLVVREAATPEGHSRRAVLRTTALLSASALTLPVLLTLSASEQPLHAGVPGSTTSTTSTSTTSTSTTSTSTTSTSTTSTSTTSTTSTTTSTTTPAPTLTPTATLTATATATATATPTATATATIIAAPPGVVPAIPTLGGVGKWLFGLLVALAGWLGLRRRG